jgi:hypothetical protein
MNHPQMPGDPKPDLEKMLPQPPKKKGKGCSGAAVLFFFCLAWVILVIWI